MKREFLAADADQKLRLDHFLAARIDHLSRSRIQSLIRDGHVSVNGDSEQSPARKLRANDAIAIVEPPARPPVTAPEPISLDILFEDDDLIVINKAPGLVVHPAAGHSRGTLVNALLHHCAFLSGIGGTQRPGIVHRLDKETSGCLVAAKNDFAHDHLARQFAGREVTKIYLALAAGHFKERRGRVDLPIGRHPIHRKKMAVVQPPQGRLASTSWRVLREIGDLTLVECTLHTGRTHQIRVHLKHLAHPIAGDPLYGQRGAFPRQMLHAWRLGFQHPRRAAPLIFESPIPADFVEAGVPPVLS